MFLNLSYNHHIDITVLILQTDDLKITAFIVRHNRKAYFAFRCVFSSPPVWSMYEKLHSNFVMPTSLLFFDPVEIV